MTTIQEALIHAVATLQQGTAADYSGDTVAAIDYYTAAVARFDELLQQLPLSCRSTVTQHVTAVRYRLEELRVERSRGTTGARGAGSAAVSNPYGSKRFPQFPVEFVPHPPPASCETAPYTLPQAPIARPFALMQLLSRSIQSGAFLTPDLFISKAVWYQEGASGALRSLGAKVRYLSGLSEALEPLCNSPPSLGDTVRVERILNDFWSTAEQLRSTLETEMGGTTNTSTGGSAAVIGKGSSKGSHSAVSSDNFLRSDGGEGEHECLQGGTTPRGGNSHSNANTPAKKEKSMFRGVTSLFSKGTSLIKSAFRGTNEGTYNSYLAWSANVLEQCQVLDRWMVYYTHPTTIPPAPLPNSLSTSAKQRNHTRSTNQPAPSAASIASVYEMLCRVSQSLLAGLVMILVQDALVLCERYAERSRESASRFLPVEVKLTDEED